MSSLLLGASWIDFSARYKIRLGGARRALAALPIYGCYDVGFGLIAEEVDKINPALVTRDKEGKPYTVRYDQVNAMLLNEFLKEHRKVEELNSTVATKLATIADLKSTVAQQQKGLEGLTEQLREQAAQIQKVSARLATASPSHRGLRTSKFATGRIRGGGPAPQVVNNP